MGQYIYFYTQLNIQNCFTCNTRRGKLQSEKKENINSQTILKLLFNYKSSPAIGAFYTVREVMNKGNSVRKNKKHWMLIARASVAKTFFSKASFISIYSPVFSILISTHEQCLFCFSIFKKNCPLRAAQPAFRAEPPFYAKKGLMNTVLSRTAKGGGFAGKNPIKLKWLKPKSFCT